LLVPPFAHRIVARFGCTARLFYLGLSGFQKKTIFASIRVFTIGVNLCARRTYNKSSVRRFSPSSMGFVMSGSAPEVDLRQRIARVVAEEVAPLLQMDGGEIEVVAVDGGVVQVRLGGACGCCPGSVQAVIFGIEDELRRRVPEVEYLEVVP
jgi:Fe-S cluster biogenesis protein NfuA